MKKIFTLILAFFVAGALTVQAQINAESPFPATFEVTSPTSIAGEYDYGAQTQNAEDPNIWGPQLSGTLSGELVWAYDDTDSLGCNAIATDLTGKFALIRRGVCEFGTKVYNAEQAGAEAVVIVNHYDNIEDAAGTIVGMLGGVDGPNVTIPAVFVSRNTAEIIIGELDAGNTVEVAFVVSTFYDPVSSFSYHTPLDEAIPFNDFQVNFVNPSATDALDVTVTASVTNPSGTTDEITGTLNVGPLGDSIITLDGSYTPTELGEYSVAWTNSANSDFLQTAFVATENTWAVDDGTIDLTAGPSDADFSSAEGNLFYQVGGLVLVDDDGAVATSASFGLANADLLFTGDQEADQILITLYDADNDEDDVIDFTAGGSFNDLTAVAFGLHLITGNELAGELINVQLEDLTDNDNAVDLKPGGAYYISVVYDGVLAGTGVAPRFVSSDYVPYTQNLITTPLFLDQLYSGWADRTVAIRLHREGFVGTDDLPLLEVGELSISPNPTTEVLNVEFDLNERASEVDAMIIDITGRVVQRMSWNDVQTGLYPIDVSNLSSGSYILSVMTPEGYRANKFIKQ